MTGPAQMKRDREARERYEVWLREGSGKTWDAFCAGVVQGRREAEEARRERDRAQASADAATDIAADRQAEIERLTARLTAARAESSALREALRAVKRYLLNGDGKAAFDAARAALSAVEKIK